MATQWVKKEAKKNELALLVERCILWATSHREIALGGLGVAALALIAGSYMFVRQNSLQSKAWEKLAAAQNQAYSGQIKPALEQLRQLSSEQPNAASGYALLLEGDLLYRQGLYKESHVVYKKMLSQNTPKTLVPFAKANLCLAQEASGNFREAAGLAQDFIGLSGDHFLAPHVYASLARSLSILGEKDQAKTALEKIALLYPDSRWAQWAQSKLKPEGN